MKDPNPEYPTEYGRTGVLIGQREVLFYEKNPVTMSAKMPAASYTKLVYEVYAHTSELYPAVQKALLEMPKTRISLQIVLGNLSDNFWSDSLISEHTSICYVASLLAAEFEKPGGYAVRPQVLISNLLYKKFGIKTTTELKKIIGDTFASLILPEATFELEFRPHMNWRGSDGDTIGEQASCYSPNGSFKWARVGIEKLGGGAIVFWKNGSTIGRCHWLPDNKGGVIVFNAYAKTGKGFALHCVRGGKGDVGAGGLVDDGEGSLRITTYVAAQAVARLTGSYHVTALSLPSTSVIYVNNSSAQYVGSEEFRGFTIPEFTGHSGWKMCSSCYRCIGTNDRAFKLFEECEVCRQESFRVCDFTGRRHISNSLSAHLRDTYGDIEVDIHPEEFPKIFGQCPIQGRYFYRTDMQMLALFGSTSEQDYIHFSPTLEENALENVIWELGGLGGSLYMYPSVISLEGGDCRIGRDAKNKSYLVLVSTRELYETSDTLEYL